MPRRADAAGTSSAEVVVSDAWVSQALEGAVERDPASSALGLADRRAAARVPSSAERPTTREGRVAHAAALDDRSTTRPPR